MEFYNTTMRVLGELEADTKHMLVVFNKVDKVEDPAILTSLRRHFPDALFISVHSGDGLDALVSRISEFVGDSIVSVELRLPAARADLLAKIHREGAIAEINYDGDIAHILASIPKRSVESFAAYLVNPKAADAEAAASVG